LNFARFRRVFFLSLFFPCPSFSIRTPRWLVYHQDFLCFEFSDPFPSPLLWFDLTPPAFPALSDQDIRFPFFPFDSLSWVDCLNRDFTFAPFADFRMKHFFCRYRFLLSERPFCVLWTLHVSFDFFLFHNRTIFFSLPPDTTILSSSFFIFPIFNVSNFSSPHPSSVKARYLRLNFTPPSFFSC